MVGSLLVTDPERAPVRGFVALGGAVAGSYCARATYVAVHLVVARLLGF